MKFFAETKTVLARRRMRGVTLIELLTVIVVVAILGSIATSSYRSYLLRTNRTEARMALLRVQAAQEKFFLQNRRYADDDEIALAPPEGLGVPATSVPGNFYSISISEHTDTTYTAKAVAINGQTSDKANCQVLTINELGERTPLEGDCWR